MSGLAIVVFFCVLGELKMMKTMREHQGHFKKSKVQVRKRMMMMMMMMMMLMIMLARMVSATVVLMVKMICVLLSSLQ